MTAAFTSLAGSTIPYLGVLRCHGEDAAASITNKLRNAGSDTKLGFVQSPDRISISGWHSSNIATLGELCKDISGNRRKDITPDKEFINTAFYPIDILGTADGIK